MASFGASPEWESDRPVELLELTSARGFAALAVVLYHVDAYSGGPIARVLPVEAVGRFAVDFFFVLSGFVLTHVYGAAWAAGRYSHRDFLIRRFARIWPMHMACLLGVAAIVGAGSLVGLRPPWEPSWSSFAAHATLVHATGLAPEKAWNQPSWSVSAEWTAYLAFPLYLMVCSKLKGPAAKLVAAAALFAAVWLSFRLFSGRDLLTITNEGALRIVPSFFAGVALRQCLGLGVGASLSRAALNAGLALVLVAAAAALAAGAPAALVWPALPALVALLALHALKPGGRGMPMRSRPLVWFGDVSYALYLVHAPILMVAYGVFGKVVGVTSTMGLLGVGALSAGVSIVVAGLAHRLIERPAQRAIIAATHAGRSRAAALGHA